MIVSDYIIRLRCSFDVLILKFVDTPHHLQPLISAKHDCLVAFLKVLGQPLMIRNIGILRSIYEIDTIEIPERYSLGFKLLRDNFPSLHIETIRENIDESGRHWERKKDFWNCYPIQYTET